MTSLLFLTSERDCVIAAPTKSISTKQRKKNIASKLLIHHIDVFHSWFGVSAQRDESGIVASAVEWFLCSTQFSHCPFCSWSVISDQ